VREREKGKRMGWKGKGWKVRVMGEEAKQGRKGKEVWWKAVRLHGQET